MLSEIDTKMLQHTHTQDDSSTYLKIILLLYVQQWLWEHPADFHKAAWRRPARLQTRENIMLQQWTKTFAIIVEAAL